MDGLISTGFPCMICGERRAVRVTCVEKLVCCGVVGVCCGAVVGRLQPYLFPFLGMDFDHWLGVNRGLDLRAEVGYDVLKAHCLRVMITVRRRSQFLWSTGERDEGAL